MLREKRSNIRQKRLDKKSRNVHRYYRSNFRKNEGSRKGGRRGEGLLHEQMEHWCIAGEIRGKGGAHQNTERCSGGTTDSWLAGWLAAELWTDSSNSR